MKNFLFIILTLFFVNSYGQTSNDEKLDKRLKEYLDLNKKMNYEHLIDYLHPRLFTIAPKEAVLKSFKESFANDDDVKIVFDSLAIQNISSVFSFEKTDYRKVDYYMSMTLTFMDTTMSKDDFFIDMLKSTFAKIFPGKQLAYNKNKNELNVSGTEIMFALKDPLYTEWLFLGYQAKNDLLIKKIYPEAVLKHFVLL